jgi:NAD(P)-dependent dehydrogenase (short-subunit alcohol dehydrogenase family)
VHNAGMLGERAPIEHHDVVKWMRTMHVNVNAPFILTRFCLPLLKRAADASIVFTTSGIVAHPRAYWGAYLTSKWAVQGLSRMLADELEATRTIRVNSINPGKVRTNMRLQAYPAEDRSQLAAPEAIVAPYLFLLGPDSAGVNGATVDCQ